MRAWVEMRARCKSEFAVVLIDADDFLRLGSRTLSIGSHGYPQMYDGGTTLLHRWVLGLRTGDRMIGDHRNGDPLDNRRSNLRVVNPSGSSQNVSGRGASRFRGVYPLRSGRWQAKVKFRGKVHHLGSFATEGEAAKAADTKRRELMPFYEPQREQLAS